MYITQEQWKDVNLSSSVLVGYKVFLFLFLKDSPSMLSTDASLLLPKCNVGMTFSVVF
jgi:hypothetical protein